VASEVRSPCRRAERREESLLQFSEMKLLSYADWRLDKQYSLASSEE